MNCDSTRAIALVWRDTAESQGHRPRFRTVRTAPGRDAAPDRADAERAHRPATRAVSAALTSGSSAHSGYARARTRPRPLTIRDYLEHIVTPDRRIFGRQWQQLG